SDSQGAARDSLACPVCFRGAAVLQLVCIGPLSRTDTAVDVTATRRIVLTDAHVRVDQEWYGPGDCPMRVCPGPSAGNHQAAQQGPYRSARAECSRCEPELRSRDAVERSARQGGPSESAESRQLSDAGALACRFSVCGNSAGASMHRGVAGAVVG